MPAEPAIGAYASARIVPIAAEGRGWAPGLAYGTRVRILDELMFSKVARRHDKQ